MGLGDGNATLALFTGTKAFTGSFTGLPANGGFIKEGSRLTMLPTQASRTRKNE